MWILPLTWSYTVLHFSYFSTKTSFRFSIGDPCQALLTSTRTIHFHRYKRKSIFLDSLLSGVKSAKIWETVPDITASRPKTSLCIHAVCAGLSVFCLYSIVCNKFLMWMCEWAGWSVRCGLQTYVCYNASNFSCNSWQQTLQITIYHLATDSSYQLEAQYGLRIYIQGPKGDAVWDRILRGENSR